MTYFEHNAKRAPLGDVIEFTPVDLPPAADGYHVLEQRFEDREQALRALMDATTDYAMVAAVTLHAEGKTE